MSKKDFTFYPIYDDRMFKIFFGNEANKEFLQDLLESCLNLEEGKLENLEIINPIVLGDNILSKEYELDIKVKLPDGTFIDIEMQNVYNTIAEIKSFTYLTKLFSNQLKKNEKYNKVKRTISINFTKDLQIHKNDNAMQKFNMTNQNNIKDIMLKNMFETFVINVECDCERLANKRLANWIKFIRPNNLEEMNKLKEISPKMKRAVERSLEIMDYEDLSTLDLQRKFQRWQREEEERQREKELRKELRTEFKKELRQQELDIAKNLILNTDYNLESISSWTGVSLCKLKKLKATLSIQEKKLK